MQANLTYEKSTSSRLTQEIRRLQSSAMETTVFMPRKEAAVNKTETVVAATNTSAMAPSDSPTWSSGSGAIKEIRLHDAEMKVGFISYNKFVNSCGQWLFVGIVLC